MSSQPIKVLLLEDNQVDAILLQGMLRQVATQFQVKRVERLSEVLLCPGNECYDLILSDLTLPDSQGLGTFGRLKTATAETPIVVISGVGDETIASRLFSKVPRIILSRARWTAMRWRALSATPSNATSLGSSHAPGWRQHPPQGVRLHQCQGRRRHHHDSMARQAGVPIVLSHPQSAVAMILTKMASRLVAETFIPAKVD